MAIIKVGQKYTLELETDDDDVASATTLEIWYKGPEGITGEITATTKVADDSVVTADITSVINKKNGPWKFQVYAVISGSTYYGSTFEQDITRHFY